MPLADEVYLTALARVTQGYSGADIEALCREAGMQILRRGIDSKGVSIEDFKKAMVTVGSGISPEMENWYLSVTKQFRKPVKIATPVA